jgi:predicted dehydrogenase
VDTNPIIEMLGRPLRLAVIGGGPGSFIGAMHRTAARLDGRYELVAGVLSTDPERSRTAAVNIGIDPRRAYRDAMEMLEAEHGRDDGAEVVAIMTPNDSHHRYAMAALERGFDVICDKPMTNTLDEALDIVAKVDETGLVFCLTHNYTGYPMVRQARALVEDGQIGVVRLVQVEYVQGGKADETDPQPAEGLPWRYDPVRGGPSLVMGDIGTHAHNLVRFISRLEVSEVAAEIGHVVPQRPVDDYGAAMLRFDNGARGTFWVTQTAAGVENGLRIRVSGTKGSLEWHQERPTRLTFKPLGAPVRQYTPNGPGILPGSARACRIVAGHPEGFHEAFANIYSDAAEVIAARRSGREVDPLARWFPNARDGAIGVKFVDAAVASSHADGAWTDAALSLEEVQDA